MHAQCTDSAPRLEQVQEASQQPATCMRQGLEGLRVTYAYAHARADLPSLVPAGLALAPVNSELYGALYSLLKSATAGGDVAMYGVTKVLLQAPHTHLRIGCSRWRRLGSKRGHIRPPVSLSSKPAAAVKDSILLLPPGCLHLPISSHCAVTRLSKSCTLASPASPVPCLAVSMATDAL